MKYKMIAVDLDGTLLSPAGEVTPRTRAAIHSALQAGLLVCFATGRNFTESQTVLDAVAHYDSAVFVGGAMVIDTRQRVTLHRTLMSPDLARKLCQFFESHGHAVMAMQDTASAGVDYLISQQIEPSLATKQWMTVNHVTVEWVNNLAEHEHAHTIRVGIVASTGAATELHDELQAAFGPTIVSHCMRVPGYDAQVLEVFDQGVSKWEGILHVARRHGVVPEEIIAIGDDLNDLPMVQNAGLGVAMGNGHPQLQACAKAVIGHNRDEGLALFLEELLADRIVEPAGDN